MSLRRADIAPLAAALVTPLSTPSGYGPADLQSAYTLTAAAATRGAGLTVAVVDAYDLPTAEADLATYRSQYGLPACTTANGCFRKVDQNGGTNYPVPNTGWGGEIALDMDMVSAICPRCNILLVEADSASMANLGAAVNEAAALGAVAISNSYLGSEFSGESAYDTAYYNHPGIAVTASSGDSGYGVGYPASSPNVIAVGGTSLARAASVRGWTETAWSGAGSGCSTYEPKPAWQHDAGCSRRTVADISAVADPGTGVAVFSASQNGWVVFGGTSVSSPIIASTYALAGTPAAGTYPGTYLYAASTVSLNDVTTGSNGTCGGSYLCTAGAGYDGPTGLGTPAGTAAFTATNNFSISASPTSLSVAQGAAGGSTISTALVSGSAETVALSASGLPAGVTASFSPTSVTAGGSSTLTLAASGSATLGGPVTVTITGTAASATHTTSVALTVTAPVTNNFSISASPTSLSVAQGAAGGSTISTALVSGSAETVALSASGLPAGVTASFSPTSVTAGGSSTLTLAASGSATLGGPVTVTITGTAASATHTTSVALTVTAPVTNVIVNGGFETGDFTGWTRTGTTSIVTGLVHSGTDAERGGSNVATAGDSSVSQTFTVPAAGGTLSFWYRISCPDTVTYDWATATLRDNVTSITTTPLAHTCTNTGAWVQVSVNLAAQAGHSVTLTLTSHDDNFAGDPTSTLFDDVIVASAGPATNNFSISASPTSLSVAQGAAGGSTISTALVSGSAETVALSASGLPAGVTASFSPTSVTAGGSSTLTLAASGSATLGGPVTVTITGTAASATHTTSVALTVTAPVTNNFSISASPTSLSVAQGAAGGSTISTALVSGSAETVALSASGLPAGVTASFSPTSVTAGGSSTLTLAASGSATLGGPVTVTITGTAASATHTTSVALTVTAPVTNNFSISASPTSLSVAQGAAGGSTISTALVSGSAETVALSASGLPAGVTASFSPTSVTAGGSSTLTLAASGSATLGGPVTVTITGTAASATHTTSVALTVTAPVTNNFSISASPTSLSVAQGAAGGSTISTALVSGSAETVALSASGLPAGVTASFSPTSVTAGGSSTLTLAASGSATLGGPVTVTITGTAASATHTTSVALTVTAPVTNVIVNGGFETGDFTGWTRTGTTSIVTGLVHSGTDAERGGSNVATAGDSSVSQTFTVPAAGGTLSFWYRISCPDTVTYDWATATLRDNVTSITTTPLAHTCTNTGAWVQVSVNLAAQAGHSVTLTLTSHDDNFAGDPTSTLFDDVIVASAGPATNNFSISASPTSLSVAQGAAGGSTISTALVSGSAETVALSASGLPAGVTASFSPTSVTAGGSSTLTLAASGSATLGGPVTVTITGTAASATHTTSVALTVTAPVTNNFSISASPTSLSVAQGAAGGSTISTALVSGSAETVALSASGLPAGVTASFSPTSVTAGGSSTLTLAASGSATLGGPVTVTITGTAASATHTTSVALTVTAPVTNNFSISASPTSLSVAQGAAGGSTISTALVSGSAETVALSASGLPAGVTASFSPTSVTAGGSSTLTLAASGSATLGGPVTVTITGTAASATHTTSVALTVTAPVTNVIVNGGFETGDFTGWTRTGTTSIVTGLVHSGTDAERGGSNVATAGDSSVSQTFTVPAAGGTLSFWYRISCPDTVTYDWATATLRDNVTSITTTPLAHTCTNTGAWVQVSVNLAAQAGHSVTLTLTSHDDNFAGDPTSTLFDDVMVQ